MSVIKETFVFNASNSDVLAAPSRLTSIPKPGVLTIEATATDSDGANFATMTLQLPGGDIPFENLRIPANGISTTDNVMHSDTELKITVAVAAGGHVLLSVTESGSVAQIMFIVTLTF